MSNAAAAGGPSASGRERFPRSPAGVRDRFYLEFLGTGPAATGGSIGWRMDQGRLFRCVQCGFFVADQTDECDQCLCGALHLDADAGRLGSDFGDAQIEVWKATPCAPGCEQLHATRRDRIAGVILGTAVGDALGLPREGLSPSRARRIFGDDVRHALVLGRGLVSDDTEHTCMAAQALLAEAADATRFARSFAWKLRWWMLGLPAGVGLGTARAIAKLWFGAGPERSGVRSAGNGPAMRSAVLGACHATDPGALRWFTRASSRITHIDERAARAALLVAFAAAWAATREPNEVESVPFLHAARRVVCDADEELVRILGTMENHLSRRAAAQEFADALGLARGVTGYAYHTVPVALYAWLLHPGDFASAVTDVIRLGGDTDTTGAITGAIVGAGVGASGIPASWVDGLVEWPRSVSWMSELADRLSRRFPDAGVAEAGVREVPLAWPAVLPRNLLFLGIVLAHGFRRLLPPYDGVADDDGTDGPDREGGG